MWQENIYLILAKDSQELSIKVVASASSFCV